MKTLVAVYRTLREAEHAVTALRGEAVADERISLVARRLDSGRGGTTVTAGDRRDSGAATTTAITAMAAGFAALMIPYLGPVLAIGPLGVAAAAGSAPSTPERSGLHPSLVAAGVPAEDARAYVAAVRDGRALVLATVTEHELDPAIRAMQRWEPIRVVQRGEDASEPAFAHGRLPSPA